MQTRLTFHCLKRTIESSLLCPPARDAYEQLAKLVPTQTGPRVDVLDSVLFVDDTIWRFRTPADARRFADLLETYFRNFDPEYRIRALEQSVEAAVSIGFI